MDGRFILFTTVEQSLSKESLFDKVIFETHPSYMRIALSATISHRVPPEPGLILAPWALTAELASGLVNQGHDVTLYAVEESQTKARLIHDGISMDSFYHGGTRDNDKVAFLDHALLSRLYQDAQDGRYDVIHVHHRLARAIHFTPFVSTPTTITLHDRLNSPYIFEHYRHVPQLHLTPISQNQASSIPGLPYTEVVYNGIDPDIFQYQPDSQGYLLFSGRIVPEKGAHHAIAAAKEAGVPLVIAGEVLHHRPEIEEYWQTMIKPHIDNRTIIFAGELDRPGLIKAYQGAQALLFPIDWEEPFGLVMTEAMSCGTPVIAFKRGSVPEVVVDGSTGYIVTNVAEMVKAIKKISDLSRMACRQHVIDHFSLDAMVKGYERIYHQLAQAD